jgi:LAO/AO transport system kinase
MDVDFLYSGILNGNRRALAKSITSIENNHPDCEKLMAKVFPHTGKAHIIGFTGPPGAGKSTLVDKVAKEYRKREKSIGIIAVDPTSPFSGGAILGDRIRMNELSKDKEIFIRSMGTRGHLGGLARSTSDAIMLMDAFGKDVVLVETVGAGQSEVDIVENAHTTVIVEMPGLGDDIQAIKAGIFEIADIFVVNKADREGSDKAVAELQVMLEMDQGDKVWKVPVLKAVARDNQGVLEVVDTIQDHFDYLKKHNLLEELRIASLKYEFQEILKEKLYRFAFDEDREEEKKILEDLESGTMDPYTAANKVLSLLSRKKG